MGKGRRVGVFVSSQHAFGRGVLEGIIAFCRTRDDWRPSLSLSPDKGKVRCLARNVDGIIAGINRQELAATIQACGRPCVNVQMDIPVSALPLVHSDDRAIGKLGAEHLMDLGFRQLAFAGTFGRLFSRCREKAFQETVRQAGGVCLRHKPPTKYTLDWSSAWKRISGWVRLLPKPIGLMAATDSLGLQIVQASSSLGIRVPDEVAVLSAGNDSLLCQLAHPPLSSIEPGAARIGFRAAEVLEDLMSGKPAPNNPILIPPVGVVCRASTDVLAIDDPCLAKALRYVREHACDPMQIDDIAASVPLSRRSLERLFLRVLRRSPHEEIRRIQLRRATRLLAQTPMSLDQVARACGLARDVELIRVFHREMGITPGQYRRRYRMVGGVSK